MYCNHFAVNAILWFSSVKTWQKLVRLSFVIIKLYVPESYGKLSIVRRSLFKKSRESIGDKLVKSLAFSLSQM